MKKVNIYIILLIIIITIADAQKEGDNWYFGEFAGLNFSNGYPVPLSNGLLSTEEGVATISNTNGNLLFYTDGIIVWNRNHQMMPNGFGLRGHSSSTQSGVIVPKPEDNNIYYLFTASDKTENWGYRYSIVDMRLQGGLGDVTTKNVFLVDSATEKITAIKHINCRDIWVVLHQWLNNRFYAYKVTPNGIDTNAVVSTVGTIHRGPINTKIGYMKVSADGRKLAVAIHGMHILEIFDFDNSTGRVSNPVTISDDDIYGLTYGIEFSPDGSRLYLSKMAPPSRIYQFNMNLSTPDSIINSAVVLAENSDDLFFGELQLAVDGKIYFARNYEDYLGVINYPNRLGTRCNLVERGISLGGRLSKWGLPNFIQSYYYDFEVEAVSDSPICEGDTLHLNANVSSTISSATYEWTGPKSFRSTRKDPVRPNMTPGMSGKYIVAVTICKSTNYDTVDVVVFPKPEPEIITNKPIPVCEGDSVQLSTEPEFEEYKWSTGETTESIFVKKPGRYHVTVIDSNGCKGTGQIDISFYKIEPQINAGDDVICAEDSVILELPEKYISYKWSTGETESKIIVRQSGSYSVTVTDKNGCIGIADVIVFIGESPKPEILLRGSNPLCEGDTVIISVTEDYKSYLWSTGETTKSIFVKKEGTYKVTVADANGCKGSAEISITMNKKPKPVIQIIGNYPFCVKDSVILLLSENYDYFKWSTGETSSTITARTAGKYSVTVTDSNGCKGIAEITLEYKVLKPEIEIIGSIPLCEGDTLILQTKDEFEKYRWSSGDTTRSIIVRKGGRYSVDVTDSHGCTGTSDIITVTTYSSPKPKISGIDSICAGLEVEYSVSGSAGCTIQWEAQNGSIISGTGSSKVRIIWNSGGRCVVRVVLQSSNGCKGEDSLEIKIDTSFKPEVYPKNSSICKGKSVVLTVQGTYSNYRWSTGETNNTISVSQQGVYYVIVRDERGCEGKSDDIIVSEYDVPNPEITGDLLLCKDSTGSIGVKQDYASYLWNSGETTKDIIITQPGNFSVQVIDSNGCEGSSSVVVNQITVSLFIDNINLDFGRLMTGEHSDRAVNIRNESNINIIISSVYFKNNSNSFLEDLSAVLPLELPTGESRQINIRFQPIVPDDYQDSLIIVVLKPCYSVYSISLHGILQTGTKISLPDTVGIAGTDNFCIPLTASLDTKESKELKLSYKAEIRFNASVFLPDNEIPEMIENRIENGERIMVLEGKDKVINNNESVLSNLCGLVLLTDNFVNPLIIKNFEWTNPNVMYETRNGSLTITGICQPSIRPIKLFTPTAMEIQPNPASDEINIEISSEEEGNFFVKIFNMEGMLQSNFSFYNREKNTYILNMDTKNLPNGAYQILLVSPNSRLSRTALIMK